MLTNILNLIFFKHLSGLLHFYFLLTGMSLEANALDMVPWWYGKKYHNILKGLWKYGKKFVSETFTPSNVLRSLIIGKTLLSAISTWLKFCSTVHTRILFHLNCEVQLLLARTSRFADGGSIWIGEEGMENNPTNVRRYQFVTILPTIILWQHGE